MQGGERWRRARGGRRGEGDGLLRTQDGVEEAYVWGGGGVAALGPCAAYAVDGAVSHSQNNTCYIRATKEILDIFQML